MLDDVNVYKQKDPSGALNIIADEYKQASYEAVIESPDNDGREITKVVVAGMGGSALAAALVKAWLKNELMVPFEVVRSYSLPAYVDANTLVIASSYSGNTEETVACLDEAMKRGSQIAVIASGGKLAEQAEGSNIARVVIPSGIQPRMAVFYNLRALLKLMAHFSVCDEKFYNQVDEAASWLHEAATRWQKDVPTEKNIAKQIALLSVGKTPVIYAGDGFAPVAYKWKISWNENAKNVAFCNELPEFNHNEFLGWTSHPVDKPFVIFDLRSSFDHPRVEKRFVVSDKLLSGMRPKANVINMQGDSVLKQMMWASVLADFASAYVAILNGVDPAPVVLIEKFKAELM